MILVNSTGKILSWGVKNPAHPALHGETSAAHSATAVTSRLARGCTRL